MGHDENFCGDRLRMTAFLRVVESVPERPSRFRRRLPEKNDEHQTGRSDITDGPSKFGTLAVGPATLSCPSSAGTTDPERSQEDSMHTPVSGTNDPAILPDDGQDPEESLALSEVRSTATGSQSLLQNGNNEWDSTTLHSPSKRVSVYASSAKKTDARANRASDTRKRRLPVNELPLVRTTTEDGLPDRSMDTAQAENCVTEEDPIEESLESFPGRVQQLAARVASPPKRPCRGPQRPLIKKAIAQDRKRNAKARTQMQTAQHSFDGFVGEELSIPSKSKKVAIGPKKRHVPAKRAVPATIGGLCFAKGMLPAPSELQGSTQSDQSSGMRRDTLRQSGMLPPTIVNTIETSANINRAVRYPETESHMSPEEGFLRGGMDDDAIIAQLSSVTAPPRTEESDSEDDEVPNDDQSNSDAESLGPLSSDDDGSSITDQQATPARRYLSPSVSLEHGGYFQEASHFLDNTMIDDGHDFWTQYGDED